MKATLIVMLLFSCSFLSGQVLTYNDLKEINENIGTSKSAKILLNSEFTMLYKDDDRYEFDEGWCYGCISGDNADKIYVNMVIDEESPDLYNRLVITYKRKNDLYQNLVNDIEQFCGKPEIIATDENYMPEYLFLRLYKHNEDFYCLVYSRKSSKDERIEVVNELVYIRINERIID